MRAVAHGEEVCPWLTQGTAAALMGGDVTSNVHVSAREGSCEFLRSEGNDRLSGVSDTSLHMKIVISHIPPTECVTGKRLTGIGQDAFLCITNAGGKYQQIIRGRVRATYFILTLTGKEVSEADKTPSKALEQAAEEVTGNLF
jgi:hypothetical protein